jgi:hypothetical protein
MMMRMLESGGLPIMSDGERAADEDNPRGYFEVERVKDLERETDKSWIRAGRGQALKVISFLIKDLPENNRYRIIFMRRDLEEVLASQAKMHARRGTADAPDSEAIKESFRNDIARVRVMARRWPHCELLEVSYRKTIDDPTATARTVNGFLGGILDEQRMAAAVDPTLYRNRKET